MKNLERFILNVLDTVPDDGKMLSAEAITGLLPGGIDATLGDVNSALRVLDGKNQVFGVSTDDGKLWKITPNGKARVA